MARYKKYSYAQRLMLPVSLADQILPGTLEHTIHTLVENRLDLSLFEHRFHNDVTGRLAYNPKILLKVILLAYSRGMTSSRDIEEACKNNVLFIAMSCGQTFDHSTIAEFVSSMQSEILPIFLRVLLVCLEMDLLGGSLFAIDGTKIPSNASKQWSGTRKELAHKKELLKGQLKRLIERHIEADRQGTVDTPDFPHRQKQKLEEKIQKIEQFLEEIEPRQGKRGQELKTNLTDPDSAKMKTNNGTIQGYNPQAVVDSKNQVIVAGLVMNNPADNNHLEPMVGEYKANLEKIGFDSKRMAEITITADSGYYSFPNLQFCQREGITAYLPDHQFRARDPRYDGQKKYRLPRLYPLSYFSFNDGDNSYSCPTGNKLTSKGRNLKRGDRSFKQYAGKKEVCGSCSVRQQCISKGGKRKILLVPHQGEQQNLVDEMKNRIDSSEGKRIYGKRFGIVEPVFANIKAQKALKRFSFRGKEKVNVQWLLWCIIHNMEKIAKYGAKR